MVDVADNRVVFERDPETVLATASVGKVLLLLTVAAAYENGSADPGELLDRRDVEPVGDSGLWQHVTVDALPSADAAALVGAVSDNLATNVLLHRFGLAMVESTRVALGLETARLHDIVREGRDATVHAPTLSTGNAAELAALMASIARRSCVSAAVSERVAGWLALSTDLSMVGSVFRLDPLAHAQGGGGLRFINKTGTDTEVRADIGVVERNGRVLAYACLANWAGTEERLPAVLAGHRLIGELIASELP